MSDAHDDHDHGHDHGPGHAHSQGSDESDGGGPGSWWRRAVHAWKPHSHDHSDSADSALEGSAEGIRAVKVSLVALGVTAGLQALVVLVSGSVALLADTVHNLSDALTAVPLWIAFVLGRRPPTRRYTYGLGRAEDLAGVVVVLMIALSAVLAGWESIRRLADPLEVRNVGLVVLAGVIGFVGNEAVAVYRIRVGRRIGSAALVADGQHARTDGFTSLGVVASAVGVALGYPVADPLVGLLITAAIVVVLWGAARDVLRRLLDAVDPALVDAAEASLRGVDGVLGLDELRLRWIGHRVRAEASVAVDSRLSLVDAHAVAEEARHALLHDVPRLADATVHVNPHTPAPADPHHATTAHHRG